MIIGLWSREYVIDYIGLIIISFVVGLNYILRFSLRGFLCAISLSSCVWPYHFRLGCDFRVLASNAVVEVKYPDWLANQIGRAHV